MNSLGFTTRSLLTAALVSLSLLAGSLPLFAQGAVSNTVPSPREVLGHGVGERFTDAAGVVRYMEALAAASPEVRVEPYGETLEGRQLLRVVLARADRMARLDEVLDRNRELANPETPESRAREIAADNPLIVYFSFGIHGRESSSSEAAIWLAWELATGSSWTQSVLDSVVVVMDPVLNPDGRDRYVNWYRQARALRPNPSPYSWEHIEPWPGGRFSHYLFDLNRDWAWLTQPESRLRRAGWSRWTPQVHVDFHEMGWLDNYLFFPAEDPINPLYPERTLRWHEHFGNANAQAFDSRGWPYYTGEWFDFWYPSYGDTWASYLGAIGMTYEQGGSGEAGLAIERPDGFTLTLRDRADGHRTAGEATLRAAAAARHDLLLSFAEFHRTAGEGMPDILLLPGDDPTRAEALVAFLRAQEIRVERASRPFRANTEVHAGFATRQDFPAGTFLVRSRQPWGRLALAFLLPEIELDATYTYDASAWSLPYGYGVEAHQVRRVPDAGWQEVEDLSRAPLVNRPLRVEVEGGLHWSAWDDDPPEESVAVSYGTVKSPGTASTSAPPEGEGPAVEPYGYLVPPGFDSWLKMVRFIEAGGRASILVKGLTLEGRAWPAGTFFLPRHGVDELTRRVRTAGLGERAVATSSGRVLDGRDLGTRTSLDLSLPRIAVLSGDGVAPTSFGAHWFFLEQALGLPFDAVPLSSLSRLPLRQYDVLVVPELNRGGAPYLNEQRVAEIRDWVRAGGTLLAVGSAARALSDQVGGVKVRERATPDEDEVARLDRALRSREERDVARWEQQVPGAVVGVVLDTDHPLAFGVGADGQPDRAFIFHRGPLAFEPDESFESVAFFPANLEKVSGVIHPQTLEHLSRGTWLAHRALGSGRVILFADDPLYRHFWYAGFQPFVNALLVGPAM
jgi:hypothetical protein